jgi:hypothetical protein
VPDRLDVNAVLQRQRSKNGRRLRIQLQRRAGLVGIEKDFGQATVSEPARRGAVFVGLKFKREGDRAAPVRETFALHHRDTPRRASAACHATLMAVSACADSSEGVFSELTRPPGWSIFRSPGPLISVWGFALCAEAI